MVWAVEEQGLGLVLGRLLWVLEFERILVEDGQVGQEVVHQIREEDGLGVELQWGKSLQGIHQHFGQHWREVYQVVQWQVGVVQERDWWQ